MLLPAAVLAPSSAGSQQQYANSLLQVVKTPELAPGQSGSIELMLTNPYNVTIGSLSLTLQIYAFSDTNGEVNVSGIPAADRPIFAGGGISAVIPIGPLAPGKAVYVNESIRTTAQTRHGDFFNVGSYFVSTLLQFNLSGATVMMASRGFFSQSEWNSILVQGNGVYSVNASYLQSLGFQGITPDTSFTVDTPSPLYLLWISAGLGVIFAAAAYAVYVNERHRKK